METKQFYIDKIIKNEFPNNGPYYYSLLGLKTKINKNETKKIYGTYFGIDASVPYHHFLTDGIGGYLLLKNIIKDLKPVFVKTKNFDNYANFRANYEIVQMFNEPVIDVTEEDVWFENMIIGHAHVTVIPFVEFFETLDYGEDSGFAKLANDPQGHVYWATNSLNEVYKFFSIKNEFTNKNIYISRSKINKRLKSENNHRKHDRIHENVFDDTLDNMMNKIGYDIIFPEDLSFTEQIKVASSAKNFISIDGAGMINAIWCNENANIMIIQILKDYYYYWDKIIETTNKKCEYIKFFDDKNIKNLITTIKAKTI